MLHIVITCLIVLSSLLGVWHSYRMGARNQEQTRGRIGPQLRLGNLRVGELHFCPLCTALDHVSSLSRKLAYVPGPTFGFVKLLASSGSHCTKWADEQHRQAGFESRFLPDLPLPFIPTLIGLRAFDLVSSRVWWEAATNTRHSQKEKCRRDQSFLWQPGMNLDPYVVPHYKMALCQIWPDGRVDKYFASCDFYLFCPWLRGS